MLAMGQNWSQKGLVRFGAYLESRAAVALWGQWEAKQARMADLASPMGFEKHREDFGQTLGRWGVPTGPYLVLPVFGPSNFRDSPGLGVDLSVDPLGKVAQDGAYWSAWAARAVSFISLIAHLRIALGSPLTSSGANPSSRGS